MSLDEFVHRIEEREGVDVRAGARSRPAVFATLREGVPDKEFSDLLRELPRAYSEALL